MVTIAGNKNNGFVKVAVVIFIFLIALFVFLLSNQSRGVKDNRYTRINTHDCFNGRVVNVNVNVGTIFINLEDSKQLRTVDTRNYTYTPYFLDEFLTYGDSISKPAHTDTLYIYRANKRYFFIIGKFINRPEK